MDKFAAAERRRRRLQRVGEISMLAFVVLCMGYAAPAAAVPVPSLYTVEVPLDPRDPGARADAYAAALEEVLVRVTGSRAALPPDEVEALFPDPARYVMQFRSGEDDTLWVTLDGAAIERIVKAAGYTVWSSDRPLTIIWLAVDSGRGSREIVAADEETADDDEGEIQIIERNRLLRERIEEAAAERGIPVTFPLLDGEDLESVTVSDVWGGFDEPLIAASQRYGADSILVGRMQPTVAQRNRWTWYFRDRERQWSGQPEEIIDMLADSLAARFAISGGDRLADISLTVAGIQSVESYAAVQSYLENMDLVEELSIDTVSGDRVRYRVRAYGGRERLREALEFARLFEPADAFDRAIDAGTMQEPEALVFRYRP